MKCCHGNLEVAESNHQACCKKYSFYHNYDMSMHIRQSACHHAYSAQKSGYLEHDVSFLLYQSIIVIYVLVEGLVPKHHVKLDQALLPSVVIKFVSL